MVITKEIVSACRKAVEQAGSQSELSRQSGVSQQSISQICSVARKRNNVSKATFLRLFPYLEPHLPESMVRQFAPVSPVSFRKAAPNLQSDYILDRITEIYSSLGRAERAELLAAAEQLAEKRQDPEPVYLSPCSEKLS